MRRMNFQIDQAAEDFLQVQKCLGGDAAALGDLRDRLDKQLRAILRARGASQTEADDTLADLWGDCVGGCDEHSPLLEKYSGKCPLQAWLAMVATNRWYDAKRREARSIKIMGMRSEQSGPATVFDNPAEQTATGFEDAIAGLLRDSLKISFAACAPQDMVLLRLVFIHGLSQREVARTLSWNESKLSRNLSRAMQNIETQALAEIRKRDPWLHLNWQDFLDLCQTRQVGFL
jgi:RNA polymerase sigma factor (sigma-70 family)